LIVILGFHFNFYSYYRMMHQLIRSGTQVTRHTRSLSGQPPLC